MNSKYEKLLVVNILSLKFNFFMLRKAFLYDWTYCLKIILKILIVQGEFYACLIAP